MQKFIYLDNNATTRTCDEATKVMTDWIQSCSNPSGSSWLSKASKMLIDKSQKYVNNLCSLKDKYYVLFTSGASESNCTVVQMVIEAWYRNVGSVPHIITSAVEHKSVLDCLKHMQESGRIELTVIEPDMYGIIDPQQVDDAIKKNTALVTIMFANNELGAINCVRKIGEAAHKHNVPFHTDAVQIFGKVQLDIPRFNIDALSMSFHKLYGPPGVGMLIISKAFVDGYGLKSQISGSQQHGLRGGTENIPGIAGATAAMVQNFKNRTVKNQHLMRLRNLLLDTLSRKIPIVPFSEFYDTGNLYETRGGKPHKGKAICILGPPKDQKNSYLPSTVLISCIDYDKPFCNVKFKKLLESQGVIVSIGSACNTSSKHASHVIQSIKAPPIVKRGILRVSFGDLNTTADVKNFALIFIKSIASV